MAEPGHDERQGPARRRSQEERRAQAERALLEAAAKLFARRGVEQTSMADIGEEAGYSRGLANHHFGSRAELVNRLARRAQSDFVMGLSSFGGRELQELAAAVGIGWGIDGEAGGVGDLADEELRFIANLVEGLASRAHTELLRSLGDSAGPELRALAVMVDAYLATVACCTDTTRAFYVMWGASFPEETPLRLVFAADDARFRTGVEAVVRLGQRNHTINAAVDPRGVAAAVVGMLRGISAQFTVDPEGVDLDAARSACTQFLRHTLAPAPETRPEQNKPRPA
ncbi:TetR family transcriptional regulator [Actinomadura physcomitrii]|uniref:TetR family transcriptional regulator n=1 Tax=Actinomadura physcomitrii TaxID=2650748 RepID=UPI0019207322|nr:TetR/AcrR family transcriptional regulator [Actinomadura physcomitrii]